MPLLGPANDLRYNGQSAVRAYMNNKLVWEKPPVWLEDGTFRPFDWFHANSSRVPTVMPPIMNDPGVTSTFNRTTDTLTITIPTSFLCSSLGWLISVRWPASASPMAHPDPRNSAPYEEVLDDAAFAFTGTIQGDIEIGWHYWSEDASSDTFDQWGIWYMRDFYPNQRAPLTIPARTPGTGGWDFVIMGLTPSVMVGAGTVTLTGPSVTWMKRNPA